MDPDMALEEARAAARRVQVAQDDDETREAAGELAEKFLALDEWLSKGGYDPMDWRTR